MRRWIAGGTAARGAPAAGLAALVLLLAAGSGSAQSLDAAAPALAELGRCTLGSGAEVPDCRVAYRTFGRLSPARDNVILVPTFFAGRSEDHLFMLETYVDTTRYHVVMVDAFADGHSSSPSNTRPPLPGDWNDLTIRDMVDAQRRFLEEHLGVTRVRAIVGISMGGFQAFEWAVRHPEFAEIIVPVMGTPRPGAMDRLIYAGLAGATEQASAAGMTGPQAWMQASRTEHLFMGTPRAAEEVGFDSVAGDVESLAGSYAAAGWSLDDYTAQARALASHDVSADFGGDMQRAAASVRARMLVVYSPDDRMVSPGPPAEFARLVGADTIAVPSPCGHAVFWCETGTIGRAVREFIDGGEG